MTLLLNVRDSLPVGGSGWGLWSHTEGHHQIKALDDVAARAHAGTEGYITGSRRPCLAANIPEIDGTFPPRLCLPTLPLLNNVKTV